MDGGLFKQTQAGWERESDKNSNESIEYEEKGGSGRRYVYRETPLLGQKSSKDAYNLANRWYPTLKSKVVSTVYTDNLVLKLLVNEDRNILSDGPRLSIKKGNSNSTLDTKLRN